ncbi:DUF4178 domain-containing protein [Pontivivens ytuae]|uniref:DUF4178 domain-containing protein n=1 Tax=Pontivivens ytuae TaxID=2789856 RepID=A0A7S9LT19_9RHOB|nr:DUF4178 domain-containing protein [Pontivivens ytuae]QPH54611.1 DUF4178 domain-containing protein [Pontivivens ytuae]
MTRPESFNCTNCGAGLSVLGGGRVRAHVCSYCGAELDAQDGYKVIAQFRDMPRPESPLAIGMTGEVYGVPFTVIGTIAWRERYGGRTWTWVDHQVFSWTHGYAWITWEDGHLVFTRKIRDLPAPAFISARTIENAESRPAAHLGRTRYRYYGSGRPEATFIEGEFNYTPKLDEDSFYVSLMGDDQMLTMRETGKEREYELSRHLDRAATFASFRIAAKDWRRPSGVHPLQAFRRSSLALFARNLTLAGAAAAVVLSFALGAAGTRIAQSGEVSVRNPLTLPFEVTAPQGLTEISIWSDVSNSWAWYEVELYDAEDEPVAAFDDGMGYYFGRDSDGRWTEGSRWARAHLLLPPGNYTLEMAQSEAAVDWQGGQLAQRMAVEVTQGKPATRWLWYLAFAFLAVGGGMLVQRTIHNTRRWSGSDWSDD